MLEKYKSRKFILAFIALVAGIVGLMFGRMDGTQFSMLAGVVLGAYGMANITEGKKEGPTVDQPQSKRYKAFER